MRGVALVDGPFDGYTATQDGRWPATVWVESESPCCECCAPGCDGVHVFEHPQAGAARYRYLGTGESPDAVPVDVYQWASSFERETAQMEEAAAMGREPIAA